MIEIKSSSPVTCEAVWDSIYAGLQEPIVDSEWGLIMNDKKHRESMLKAQKKREESDKDKRLKRIDYLGDATLFKGLEKDEDYAKQRLLLGVEACPETWVVKLSA